MISVLYVDDEPGLLDILKLKLEQTHLFKVDTSGSAKNALQKLKDTEYDAVVSDYQIPEMDGIELLKLVRKEYPHLPFIIFTGRGREAVAIEALNNGADFYLQKGIESKALFAELQNMIQKAVERRRAEEALKESEEKYRILAENAPIGILTCDRTGQITYLNTKVLEILGSPGEEKTREINLLQFPPLIEVGFAKALRTTLETGVLVQSLNAEYTSKWGKTVYFRTYISPIIGNGSVQGAQIILDDITQQKQLEDALLTSEERYRNVVQTQTEFITRFLPDGTHIFVNDAYCNYFDKTPREMIGSRFVPNVPKEDRSRLQWHFASINKKNPVATIEHRIVMPDGEIRWQVWNDRAIFNEKGELVEYQSVGRDVTKRKNAEEALRNSEQLSREIIDNLPDATFAVNKKGEVIVWNREMEEITGVSASEMIGKGNLANTSDFFGEPRTILIDYILNEDDEVLKKYSSIKREGDVLIAETPIIQFQNRDVALWGKASPLYDQDGDIIGAIETIRIMPENKRSG